MTWVGDITVRGVRQIESWDVTLPDVIGPPHAILVGPCGSGKSSILQQISEEIGRTIGRSPHPSRAVESGSAQERKMAFFNRPLRIGWTREAEVADGFREGRWITATLSAPRAPLRLDEGVSPTAPDPVRPLVRLGGGLTTLLVERDAARRLAESRNDRNKASRIEEWIEETTSVVRRILGDERLSFVIGEHDVAIDFSDGRRLPLAALSTGHAAALTVWAELFLRVEAARRRTEDPSHSPKGVLLVDAVEAYLDPRLQRTLLPLLAERFSGIQIIASTSSPIVASSLDGATLLDLAARKTRTAPSLPPPAVLPPKPRRRRRSTLEGPGPWDDD